MIKMQATEHGVCLSGPVGRQECTRVTLIYNCDYCRLHHMSSDLLATSVVDVSLAFNKLSVSKYFCVTKICSIVANTEYPLIAGGDSESNSSGSIS
jgi:hypothetical protein